MSKPLPDSSRKPAPPCCPSTHSPLARAKQTVYEPEVPEEMPDPGALMSINGCDPQLFPCAISFRLIPTRLPDPKMSSGSVTRPGVAT